MNREKFREMYDLLMEQLDVSRELSDDEILGVIDELILTLKGTVSFTEGESRAQTGAVLFCAQAGCSAGTDR